MIIKPIKPQPTFGYSNILKTEWLKGNLKIVKKGFYGDELTKQTVSLEHLKPASQGGKTILPNLVLASKKMNQARGCDDLKKYVTKNDVVEYLRQFIGIKTKRFDGDEYISKIIETLKTLGINL